MEGVFSEYSEFLNNFWTNLSIKDTEITSKHVICNWNHFIIGNPNSAFRGFDGRKFKITYLNGNEEQTNNLWHQGLIPEEFRHLFKNNASNVGII